MQLKILSDECCEVTTAFIPRETHFFGYRNEFVGSLIDLQISRQSKTQVKSALDQHQQIIGYVRNDSGPTLYWQHIWYFWRADPALLYWTSLMKNIGSHSLETSESVSDSKMNWVRDREAKDSGGCLAGAKVKRRKVRIERQSGIVSVMGILNTKRRWRKTTPTHVMLPHWRIHTGPLGPPMGSLNIDALIFRTQRVYLCE